MTVPERMLSLAIGREGQNARLAAKLTGWRIDIRSTAHRPPAEAAPRAVAEPRPGRDGRAGGRGRAQPEPEPEPVAEPASPLDEPPSASRRRRRGASPADAATIGTPEVQP